MIDVPARVKDSLKDGTYRKNYRINVMKSFVNDDGSEIEELDFVIDNNNLKLESVLFNERMCSTDYLKFGLCEGTDLEFQYFDFPNITGRRIQVFLDVEYMDKNNTISSCEIPMGWFTVEECARQASTGILKASCYNKLLSKYLDEKANDLIIEVVKKGDGIEGECSIKGILTSLLDDYQIKEKAISKSKFIIDKADFGNNTETWHIDYYPIFNKDGVQIGKLYPFYNVETEIMEINSYIDYFEVIDTSVEDGDFPYIDIDFTGLNNYIEKRLVEIMGDNIIDYGWGEKITIQEYIKRACAYRIYLRGTIDVVGGQLISDYVVTNESVKWETNDIKRCNSDNNFNIINFFPSEYEGYGLKFEFTDDKETIWISIEKIIFDYITKEIDHVCVVLKSTKMEKNVVTIEEAEKLPDVTLRDLQSAVFELSAKFGRLDRATDLFAGVALNNNRLLPSEELYPSDILFPMSNSARANKAMYSKLWADEGNVRKFRYLIITYKGLNEEGNEEEKTLQRTVNTDGTDNYNMSDNWMFRNLIWTAEEVGQYADEMVQLIKNVTWFPFEMWCAGLPYIETGDEIEVDTGNGVYSSYVLTRQLKGIQNLQDSFTNGTLNIF